MPFPLAKKIDCCGALLRLIEGREICLPKNSLIDNYVGNTFPRLGFPDEAVPQHSC